jgi:hypothetical protein
MCAPSYYFVRGRLEFQVSCLCLTFHDLRDGFPCALQCAFVEMGVAARTWFDVRSCNSTNRVTLVWDGWASAFWVRRDHYGYGRRWGCCWIIGLLFVVTMGLLLNYWSCWWIHVGGFGYYWVSSRIIDLLILVWHLDWWWCCLFNDLISVEVSGLSQTFLD